jgi:hypothetical protein
MSEKVRQVMRAGVLSLLSLLPARHACAQAIIFEPFVGVGSGPSATAGASVWQMGTDVLGFRESVGWMGANDTRNAGGFLSGGVVFAAPIAGGPPIRPYVGLDVGVAKQQGTDACPFLRPAIGLLMQPGARVGYVVESGLYVNRRQADEWSLLVGLIISR